jgi:uncharacterized protein YbgA (DUF1722 family)
LVERARAQQRLRAVFSTDWGVGTIVEFHTSEKLLLRARDEVAYGYLGRLVAGAATQPREVFAAAYQHRFMSAIAQPATVRRHTNVLQHMLGYLRATGDEHARREVHRAIEDYRRGLIPLIRPLALFASLAERHRIEYLQRQSYLRYAPRS